MASIFLACLTLIASLFCGYSPLKIQQVISADISTEETAGDTVAASISEVSYSSDGSHNMAASSYGITLIGPPEGSYIAGITEIAFEFLDPREIIEYGYSVAYPHGGGLSWTYSVPSRWEFGPNGEYIESWPTNLKYTLLVNTTKLPRGNDVSRGDDVECDGDFEVAVFYRTNDGGWNTGDSFRGASLGMVSTSLKYYSNNRSDYIIETNLNKSDRYYDDTCPMSLRVTSSSGNKMKSVRVTSGGGETILNESQINSPTFAKELSWDTRNLRNGNHSIIIEVQDEVGWKTYDRNDVVILHEEEIKSRIYFAEGYTGYGFETFLSLGAEPSDDPTVVAVFMLESGERIVKAYSLEHYRSDDGTLNGGISINKINQVVGENQNVSIEILSDGIIVAERPTYFNYKGKWSGGHAATGAANPAKEWYFAEGTTREEFEEWICIQNPNTNTTRVTLSFMIEGEGLREFSENVLPTSRSTFYAPSYIGTGKDVSLKVTADLPVVAERPMYFEYIGLANRHWKGGHNIVGANAPDTSWYFAEGTTREGFEEWLTLQNPNPFPIEIDAHYQMGVGQGTKDPVIYSIPPYERKTIPVNYEIGPEKDVSVHLSSENPFLAERPMYFSYTGYGAPGWEGGDVVMGTASGAKRWWFAPTTYCQKAINPLYPEWSAKLLAYGQHIWLCIQNPGSTAANVQARYFTYLDADKPTVKSYVVPANSRYTVLLGNEIDTYNMGGQVDYMIQVESDQPIIVERPLYFRQGDEGGYSGGYCVLGSTLRDGRGSLDNFL